jgi:hypothetical protein
MNRRRLLKRLQEGHLRNVRFADLVNLAEGFGFRLDRVRGSHHILRHPVIRKSLNLQDDNGQAKSYQVRQLLQFVTQYNLELED